MATVPLRHPASGLGEGHVEEDRPVPAVCQLIAVQEHPFDDDHGVDGHLFVSYVDRCIPAVVEDRPPDSSISSWSERIQYVLGQCDEVVGIEEEAIRRVSAVAMADLPRSQEVVLVHDDRGSSGALDRACKVAREGGLSRSVHTVHRDHDGTSERDNGLGELVAAPARAQGHDLIMPAAHAGACRDRATSGRWPAARSTDLST